MNYRQADVFGRAIDEEQLLPVHVGSGQDVRL
jgi:hypothetical protein